MVLLRMHKNEHQAMVMPVSELIKETIVIQMVSQVTIIIGLGNILGTKPIWSI